VVTREVVLKLYSLIFICIVLNIFGQEASDYYNRPVQEVMEKIPGQVQDTSLMHSGGFLQTYNEIQDWAADKKTEDAHFKSVTSFDSLGTVQLIMHSDCLGLKSNGPNFDYYMTLTAFSKSIKIEFWNIDYKKKDCDKGFRKSLEIEVVNLIRNFVDSTLYIHKPCRGLQVKHIVQHELFIDSSIQDYDSIFECVKKDSIIQYSKDSLNAILSAIKVEPTEAPKINIDSANKVLDSLERVVDADSVSLYHEELSFFKTGHTTQISCKGKIEIGVRLECVDFLLSKKLRSPAEISKYLIILYKFCIDKSHEIQAVIVTWPDEQKWKAVSVYHRAQEVCGVISQKQKDLNEKDADHLIGIPDRH
jgi:hypothetical protein